MKGNKFVFLREDHCNRKCPKCGDYTVFGHCKNCDGQYF